MVQSPDDSDTRRCLNHTRSSFDRARLCDRASARRELSRVRTIQSDRTARIAEHPLARWLRMKRVVAAWRHRTRTRHELANLSDRQLRDIGLSRFGASFESSKPFWRA